MQVKALEIRDAGTFIPALAVNMNPSNNEQRYLLKRCGYSCDGRPNIILTRLDGDETHHGDQATNDPYARIGRTWPIAHHWIIDHWNELQDGDVVDVEFALGERTTPKVIPRAAGHLDRNASAHRAVVRVRHPRSEEHTSELQSQ